MSTDKVQINVRVTRQMRDLIRLLAYAQDNTEKDVIEFAIDTYGLFHLNWMIQWDRHKTESEKFHHLLKTISVASGMDYYYNEETNRVCLRLDDESIPVDELLPEALDGFMGGNYNQKD